MWDAATHYKPSYRESRRAPRRWSTSSEFLNIFTVNLWENFFFHFLDPIKQAPALIFQVLFEFIKIFNVFLSSRPFFPGNNGTLSFFFLNVTEQMLFNRRDVHMTLTVLYYLVKVSNSVRKKFLISFDTNRLKINATQSETFNPNQDSIRVNPCPPIRMNPNQESILNPKNSKSEWIRGQNDSNWIPNLNRSFNR